MSQTKIAGIVAALFNLLDAKQWAVVPVRAVLAQVTQDEAEEFHLELYATERDQEMIDALATLSIVPPLPEGMASPLTLNEAQDDYADPDAASRFLQMAFGAQKDAIAVIVDGEVVDIEPKHEGEPGDPS